MDALTVQITPLEGGVCVAMLALAFLSAWFWGRKTGRVEGHADGLSAGYLDGRRSERQAQFASAVPPPAELPGRGAQSRRFLRIATVISATHLVRLTVDREGYLVGINVVRPREIVVVQFGPWVGEQLKPGRN